MLSKNATEVLQMQ